jgi:hypothetical protein
LGYWQTEKYFDIPLVRAAFSLSDSRLSISEKSCAMSKEILDCEGRSAFLHVRRTDYLDSSTSEYHGNLSLDYYNTAISRIRAKVDGVKFFVFSDDPEWCKLAFPEFEVVDHNKPGGRYFGSETPGQEHEDIWLMSLCRHGIIANSSFSWWGAWLGDHQPDRTVIAPAQWVNPKNTSLDTSDIAPKRWILL